jgi:hypothetical protein
MDNYLEQRLKEDMKKRTESGRLSENVLTSVMSRYERHKTVRRRMVAGCAAFGVVVLAAGLVFGVTLAQGGDGPSGPKVATKTSAFLSTTGPVVYGPAYGPAVVVGTQTPTTEAAKKYPKNSAGQTYGSGAVSPGQEEPDLIATVATNGKLGYVLRTDLDAGGTSDTVEAGRAYVASGGDKNRVIPVYESDGTTKIGVFVIGGR